LFGTDHPYITLQRWRRDFDSLEIDPEVLPMILKDNALAVLGIPERIGEAEPLGDAHRRPRPAGMAQLALAQRAEQFVVRARPGKRFVGGEPCVEVRISSGAASRAR
jgi:hypothetical protein